MKIPYVNLSKQYLSEKKELLSVISKTLKTGQFVGGDEVKKFEKKIIKNFTQKKSRTFLLHGIAGSGKTETYFEAINFCIKNKKQVLILLPEIGLTSEWGK